MGVPLINSPSLPGFEKQIDPETERLDKAFDDKGKEAKPMVTESMMLGGQQVLGSFNENEKSDLERIRKMEALDTENSIVESFPIDGGENFDVNTEEVLVSSEKIEVETTIEEKKEAVKGNVYMPTINLLVTNELITQEQYELLINDLFINKDSKNNFDVSKIEGLGNYTLIEEYINKVESADEGDKENHNTKDFISDFSEYNTENNKFEGLEEAVFGIIGRNYLKVEGGSINNEQSKEVSLLAAIETSANKINGISNTVSKTSQTYINAMKNIYSGNKENAIDGLTSLYTLIFSNIGITGSAMEKGKKSLTKTLEKRLIKIQEKIDNIEQQIKSGYLNQEKRKEKIEELDGLKVEEKEINDGEIFKSGKIDKISDEVKESPSENT